MNTLAAIYGGFEPQDKPNYYTQHAIECQTFRRHLPSALADAVKYRWRADDNGQKAEDKQRMRYFINDFVVHQELIKPIANSTVAFLALLLHQCAVTMNNGCFQDLKNIVFLAGNVKPEVTGPWLSRTLNQ